MLKKQSISEIIINFANEKTEATMKIQLQLTEQEAGAVRCAIQTRLAGIRGYSLSEEDYLQAVLNRLAKKLNQ